MVDLADLFLYQEQINYCSHNESSFVDHVSNNDRHLVFVASEHGLNMKWYQYYI